jgi:hypothetical protein
LQRVRWHHTALGLDLLGQLGALGQGLANHPIHRPAPGLGIAQPVRLVLLAALQNQRAVRVIGIKSGVIETIGQTHGISPA